MYENVVVMLAANFNGQCNLPLCNAVRRSFVKVFATGDRELRLVLQGDLVIGCLFTWV